MLTSHHTFTSLASCGPVRMHYCRYKARVGISVTVRQLLSSKFKQISFYNCLPLMLWFSPTAIGSWSDDDCFQTWGQDNSVGKSLDLQSKDCRFEPNCRWGVFLACAFSKPHSKLLVWVRITTLKTEVQTSGLGSKSLHGCKRSTSPFSLRAAEFQQMKSKQMASVDRPPTFQDHPFSLVAGAPHWPRQANLHYKLPSFPAVICLAR